MDCLLVPLGIHHCGSQREPGAGFNPGGWLSERQLQRVPSVFSQATQFRIFNLSHFSQYDNIQQIMTMDNII